jgi:putative glutamine amidotransferase
MAYASFCVWLVRPLGGYIYQFPNLPTMSLPIIGVTGSAAYSAHPSNAPLFAIPQTYIRAVVLGGGAPLVIPPHLEKIPLRAIFERLDGLILSGGGDVQPALFGEEDSGLLQSVDEQRDRTELTLARWTLTEGLPLLAICRGIQVLNVATGGTLVQDIPAGALAPTGLCPTQVSDALSHSSPTGRPRDAIEHTVKVAADSRLAALVGVGELGVNSAHHQAVKVAGAGLIITAYAPDGVIEALENPDHPFCVGVQWHPEAMVESHPVMRQLFEGLAKAAQSK